MIEGTDVDITCPTAEGGSLGTSPLGTTILGDGLIAPTHPPYFNVIPTYAHDYQYRFEQVFFYDEGIDTSWEIISFGTDSQPTAEENTSIKR